MGKLAMVLACILLPQLAAAGTSCQTRKSGSYTITACTTGRLGTLVCRSYMSGSYRKTSCQ